MAGIIAAICQCDPTIYVVSHAVIMATGPNTSATAPRAPRGPDDPNPAREKWIPPNVDPGDQCFPFRAWSDNTNTNELELNGVDGSILTLQVVDGYTLLYTAPTWALTTWLPSLTLECRADDTDKNTFVTLFKSNFSSIRTMQRPAPDEPPPGPLNLYMVQLP